MSSSDNLAFSSWRPEEDEGSVRALQERQPLNQWDEMELLSDEQSVDTSPQVLNKEISIMPMGRRLNLRTSSKTKGGKGTSFSAVGTGRTTETLNAEKSTSVSRGGRAVGPPATVGPNWDSSDISELEDEQKLLDSAPAELDQALQSVRREMAKMQRELEKHKRREKVYIEELREYNEKVAAQETIINTLKGASSDGSHLEDIVTDLRSRLLAETDEKMFWVRKHQEAHRNSYKLEGEVQMLQTKLVDRDILWKAELERKHSYLLLEHERCRDGYHTAQKAVQEREEEVRELRQQVFGLKRNISTWTKTEGQITDDVFMEKIRSLGHDLQNWTISNFRKARIDPSTLSESVRAEIACAVPSYEKLFSDNAKLNVIQSVVAAILVAEVFSSYYFGLSDELVSHLLYLEEYFRSTVPPVKVNGWRSATLSLVRKRLDDSSEGYAARLLEEIYDRINHILTNLTGDASTNARDKGLRSILDQAVDLSKLFRVQYARFKVYSPPISMDHPLLFDSETMENVTGEDDQEVGGKQVMCVNFPCVLKSGDESGDNMQLRNVIVKAKVCC